MAKHGFTSLMRRLSRAGFRPKFANVAVLPDWWGPDCEDDTALLPDIEIRVARFIGAPLDVVRDPDAALNPPSYEGAQLRRVRDIDRDRLRSAIHAALTIAGAVVRNMQPMDLRLPPQDATAWRKQITRAGAALQLADVLDDLWARGVPIIHVATLPSPTFQGLAAIVDGRPVVVIGHDIDEPARLAFLIAHETGHIVHDDCQPGQPVVDEEEEIRDDHTIEQRADAYATALITGDAKVPLLTATGFKDLANKAHALEKQLGVDASAIVWTWARHTGDYALAQLAAQALYKTKGGKRLIRSRFDKYVDVANATDSDRALIRCIHGDPPSDAAAS